MQKYNKKLKNWITEIQMKNIFNGERFIGKLDIDMNWQGVLNNHDVYVQENVGNVSQNRRKVEEFQQRNNSIFKKADLTQHCKSTILQ